MDKPISENIENEEESDSEIASEVPMVSGQPSADFVGILINAMQDARREDFDYLHFKQNLKSLDHLDFDLKTRFQTAFAIARNQGVDRNILIESAGFFLAVLENEEKKFLETLDKQKENRVQTKKDAIRSIRDEIFQKQTEIEQLQEEIRKLESKIEGEKAELMSNRARIEKTTSDFNSSIVFLKKKIETDIENLKKYLD